jgi:hypothetical protein
MPYLTGFVHGPKSTYYTGGIPVENASVVARGEEKTTMAQTNYNGFFSLFLPGGEYTIRVVQRDYMVPNPIKMKIYADEWVDISLQPDTQRRKF